MNKKALEHRMIERVEKRPGKRQESQRPDAFS